MSVTFTIKADCFDDKAGQRSTSFEEALPFFWRLLLDGSVGDPNAIFVHAFLRTAAYPTVPTSCEELYALDLSSNLRTSYTHLHELLHLLHRLGILEILQEVLEESHVTSFGGRRPEEPRSQSTECTKGEKTSAVKDGRWIENMSGKGSDG